MLDLLTRPVQATHATATVTTIDPQHAAFLKHHGADNTAQFGWPLFGAGTNAASQTQPSPLQAALLALECANLLEQRILHKFPHLARHAQAIGMLDKDGFSLISHSG